MFGDHGLCGLLEEGGHGKFPKCLDGNLGDFGGVLQRSLFAPKRRPGCTTIMCLDKDYKGYLV